MAPMICLSDYLKVRDVEESKRVNANVQERMALRRGAGGEAQKEDAR